MNDKRRKYMSKYIRDVPGAERRAMLRKLGLYERCESAAKETGAKESESENFMKKHKIDARLFFDEHSLIIGAFRYYCGRMTIASASFADELARAWNSLRTDTQKVIKRDLEQLFAEDDAARRVESPFKPLGMDMDRKAWEKVREKWQKQRKNAATWRIEYGSAWVGVDEGFWEWWTVTDGEKSFKCDSQEDAEWLCGALSLFVYPGKESVDMPNPSELARKDDGQTYYFTGAVVRMCDCPGPMQPVSSNGRKEYAHCDQCNRTWELDDNAVPFLKK